MLNALARRAVSLVAVALTGIGATSLADCDNPTPPLVFNPGFLNQFVAGYALDLRSDRLILGDPYATPDRQNQYSPRGFVAIYERGPDGDWIRAATLAPDPGPPNVESPRLGTAVAIDDDVAVVAAMRRSSTGPNSAIYFYRRAMDVSGAYTWTKTGKWTFPEIIPGFDPVNVSGVCIAGDTALVACLDHDAITFTRDEAAPMGWKLDSQTIPAIAHGGGPTRAVAFDGRFAVFARPASYSDPVAFARVYERTPSGWVLRADLPGRVDDPRFGICTSIDGDLIAVGSNREPDSLAVGYVRLYRRAADGSWPLEAELEHPTISDAPPKSGFGIGVSVRGNRVAVGSIKDDFTGLDAGAVHVFEKSSDRWHGVATYTLTNSDAAWLGMNVVMTDDLIAASAEGLDGVGGAVIFDRCAISGTPGDPTPRCLPGVLGLLTYVDAFFAGSPFADFNRNGAVSIQDLFDFLAAWFSGCP